MNRIVAYVACWVRGGTSTQHSFVRDENGVSHHEDRSSRDWIETYLIGQSDTDARWYYERRRWLT